MPCSSRPETTRESPCPDDSSFGVVPGVVPGEFSQLESADEGKLAEWMALELCGLSDVSIRLSAKLGGG